MRPVIHQPPKSTCHSGPSTETSLRPASRELHRAMSTSPTLHVAVLVRVPRRGLGDGQAPASQYPCVKAVHNCDRREHSWHPRTSKPLLTPGPLLLARQAIRRSFYYASDTNVGHGRSPFSVLLDPFSPSSTAGEPRTVSTANLQLLASILGWLWTPAPGKPTLTMFSGSPSFGYFSIQQPTELKKLYGETFAVDTYEQGDMAEGRG